MAKAKDKTFRDYTVRLLEDTFVGQGLDGHLASAGSVVTIPLQIASSDIEEDGEVVTKAGEPIYDDNLEILEEAGAEGLEVVPAGAPNGARPTGVPGVFMVPVGDNWQVWQPGDPDSSFMRRAPEEFAANNPDAPTIAETLEKAGLDPNGGGKIKSGLVDPDNDGKAGGFVKKADLAAEAEKRGLTVDDKATRDDIAAMIEADKKAKGE